MAFGRLVKFLNTNLFLGFLAFADRNLLINGNLVRGATVSALWVSVCLCLSLNVMADEIVVAGVRLPVTEIRKIDDKNVKLVIGDSAEILSRDQAEIRAVEVTFSDGVLAQRFPLSSYGAVADFVARRGASAGAAMKAVIAAWSTQVDPLSAEDLNAAVRELLASDAVAAFLNTSPINSFFDSRGGIQLLSELAARDPAAFSIRASGITGDSAVTLSKSLRDLALSAVSVREFDRATNAARAMLSLGTNSDARSLTVFVQRLRESVSGLNSPQEDEFASAARRLFELSDNTTDRLLRDVLNPFLVEAVHRSATHYITSGKFGDAISALSKIPLDKCTPTTHRLVQESLGNLNAEEAANLLREKSVSQFLIRWAALDQTLAYSLRQTILRVGVSLGRSRDPALISQFIQIYPLDPNDADNLRRIQTDGFLTLGLVQAARESAASITNYGILDTFRFMWHGLYGGTLSTVCYVISLFLALTLLVIKLRGHRNTAATEGTANPDKTRATQGRSKLEPTSFAREQRNHEWISKDLDSTELDYGGGGFSVQKARMLSPSALEYRRLLAQFGLDEKADLKEIKHAYRLKVKTVHPDLNPDVTDANRAEFIELTQMYERVLKLREEIGL